MNYKDAGFKNEKDLEEANFLLSLSKIFLIAVIGLGLIALVTK